MPALSGSSEFYNEAAMRAWALSEFPETFNALPDVSDIEFINVKDHGIQCNRLPTTSLANIIHVGIYDPRSCIRGRNGNVYAFVHGKVANQVAYLHHNLELGYEILSNSTKRDVDFDAPFCDIRDGLEPAAADGRLRALICWYFLLAGHLKEVGGYKSFLREFKMACAWIANNGQKPRFNPPLQTPLITQAATSSQGNDSPIPQLDSSIGRSRARHTAHAVIKEERPSSPGRSVVLKRCHDVIDENPIQDSPTGGSHDEINTAHPPQSDFYSEKDIRSILKQVQDGCASIASAHKRARTTTVTLEAKHAELEFIARDLRVKNTRLRKELDDEKEKTKNLGMSLEKLKRESTEVELTAQTKHGQRLSESVAKAEKLESTAQSWRSRALKAEADLKNLQEKHSKVANLLGLDGTHAK